ncbi:unnamed protein product [Caenorhabditis angaria]|uniref:Uncharacterized protein n=1 Tax=Caenorhabditis angaria TaxID=860376 RepID=A0A9P1J3W6_9PELO|nr:unnamed protein product [Caenorhabditis angaria]
MSPTPTPTISHSMCHFISHLIQEMSLRASSIKFPSVDSMPTSRDSSMETSDRYPFGYTNELARTEPSASTAKRLRQRLQRQQSGQSGLSGRRYTGESSECSSLVGTPTDTGRSFTFWSCTACYERKR